MGTLLVLMVVLQHVLKKWVGFALGKVQDHVLLFAEIV